ASSLSTDLPARNLAASQPQNRACHPGPLKVWPCEDSARRYHPSPGLGGLAVLSLLVALQQVPDPRSRRGRSFPLPAILAWLTLGMLLGRRSLTAIVQLAQD